MGSTKPNLLPLSTPVISPYLTVESSVLSLDGPKLHALLIIEFERPGTRTCPNLGKALIPVVVKLVLHWLELRRGEDAMRPFQPSLFMNTCPM